MQLEENSVRPGFSVLLAFGPRTAKNTAADMMKDRFLSERWLRVLLNKTGAAPASQAGTQAGRVVRRG